MIYRTKERYLKDGTKVVLRAPRIEDAQLLLDFMIKTTDQTWFLLSSSEDFKNKTVESEEQWIKGHLESDDCNILVFKDDELIGNCGIAFMNNLKARHRGVIGITIEEKYWNKGVGTILFEEMIEVARKRPLTTQIELGVISINERALHLYKKFGFKETGIIPRAVKIKDGTYLDEIMMTKFLDE